MQEDSESEEDELVPTDDSKAGEREGKRVSYCLLM